MFTTFLVTVDLSSFDIQLLGGNQYVMSIIQDNRDNFITNGGLFRISASRATGFEDVFRADITQTLRPGYVDSQHNFGYEQFGGSFSMLTLFPGDANGDQVVDFTDLGILLNNYDQPGTFATGDFDGSGIVDFNDLGILLNNYNEHAPVSTTTAPVPEPGTLALAALGVLGLLIAARRKR